MADLSRIPTRDELIAAHSPAWGSVQQLWKLTCWCGWQAPSGLSMTGQTINWQLHLFDALADVLPGDDGTPAGFERVQPFYPENIFVPASDGPLYQRVPPYRVKQP